MNVNYKHTVKPEAITIGITIEIWDWTISLKLSIVKKSDNIVKIIASADKTAFLEFVNSEICSVYTFSDFYLFAFN
jgi:hypothetical protein